VLLLVLLAVDDAVIDPVTLDDAVMLELDVLDAVRVVVGESVEAAVGLGLSTATSVPCTRQHGGVALETQLPALVCLLAVTVNTALPEPLRTPNPCEPVLTSRVMQYANENVEFTLPAAKLMVL
jgi:hypothetical protein